MVLSASTQLKTKLKLIHARITRNRLTTVFFLFGFFHCFAQAIIQSFLFTVDSQYSTFLLDVTHAANIPPRNHTNFLGSGDENRLEMCNFIPHNPESCYYIFDSKKDVVVSNSPDIDSIQRGEIILNSIGSQNFNLTTVNISKSDSKIVRFQSSAGIVDLNATCTSTLLYPAQHLQNNRREDLVFLAIQFWLMVLSLIAMMYDSVPHVLTVFGTRVLLTAWSVYVVWRTGYQQVLFKTLIENPGTPCSVEMFGEYFQTRISYDIPDLILNCTALGISAYLSWTLLRTYNTESFTCVGAPKNITKMYKYFLALQVCLQLEAFVLLTAGALWADQLFNTYVGKITNHLTLYEAVILFYTILLGPWLLAGWFGIRYEKRIVTGGFIVLGFLFITFSSIMFYSQVYRWTFYAWPCWGCFGIASLILLVASFVLGIVCLINFNKGLSQYLYAESALSKSNFASEVFERDVESSYVDEEKLKIQQGFQPDFTTHYLPTLGPSISRDHY